MAEKIAFKDALPEGISEKELAKRLTTQGYSDRAMMYLFDVDPQTAAEAVRERPYSLPEDPTQESYRQTSGPFALPGKLLGPGFTDVIPAPPAFSPYMKPLMTAVIPLTASLNAPVWYTAEDLQPVDPDGANYMRKTGVYRVSRQAILHDPMVRRVFKATFNRIQALEDDIGVVSLGGDTLYCTKCGATFRKGGECDCIEGSIKLPINKSNRYQNTVPDEYTGSGDGVDSITPRGVTAAARMLTRDEVAAIRPHLAQEMEERDIGAVPSTEVDLPVPVDDTVPSDSEAEIDDEDVPDRERLQQALEDAIDDAAQADIDDDDMFMLDNMVAYGKLIISSIGEQLSDDQLPDDPTRISEELCKVPEIEVALNDLRDAIQEAQSKIGADIKQTIKYFKMLLKLPEMVQREYTDGTGDDYSRPLDEYLLGLDATMSSSFTPLLISEESSPEISSM